MRVLGIILIVAGAIVVALGGVSYVKHRNQASVGPVSITTEQHGFVTPLAGLVGIAIGVVLIAAGGGRRTTT